MILLEPLDPKVWHVNDPELPDDAVYVGRPSVYGNPFVVGRHGTRDEVIRMFEDYLTPDLIAKIKHELKGKHLSCWCAPKKCHANVIFRIANT